MFRLAEKLALLVAVVRGDTPAHFSSIEVRLVFVQLPVADIGEDDDGDLCKRSVRIGRLANRHLAHISLEPLRDHAVVGERPTKGG